MIFADWLNVVVESWTTILDRFVAFVPNLIGAIIILVVGWVLGLVVALLIDRLFRIVGLQTLFEKAKVEDLIKKADTDKDTTAVLASVAKWIIYLVAFISAATTLQLSAIADFLDQILNYIPEVVAAAGIVLIGMVLANFLANVIRGSVQAAGLESANTLSLVVRYSIVIFALLAALAQLGVATNFINTLFIGVVAFLAIAGGLSFGLGGQGAAQDWIDKIRKELK